MTWVGLHLRKRSIKVQLQRNVFADETRQHLFHVRNQGVEVQDNGFQDLLTAEGQKLARQRHGALAGLFDFLGMFKGSVLGSEVALQHLTVADNYAEQIVEIVRDSSGQAPDRFHFLRHAELPFQGAPFRDVLGKDLDISDRARLIFYRTTAASHGEKSAIFALPLDFNVLETLLMQKRFVELLMFRRIAIDAAGEICLQKLFFRRVTKHFFERGIDEN